MEAKTVTVGKMLDGSCATHQMKGVYSGPIQPKGTWCPLLSKPTLLGFVCTNEGCSHTLDSFPLTEEQQAGEERYRQLQRDAKWYRERGKVT